MIRKSLAAFACLASACLVSTVAQATDFAFSFSAPFDSGDTATGSGTIVADDIGGGVYQVSAVSGSWIPYQAAFGFEPPVREIIGFDTDFFSASGPVFLTTDTSGAYRLGSSGVTFYGDGAISFSPQADGSYVAFGGEVSSNNATLTITQAVTGDVPEPATWAMMVLGFGAIGHGLRRRTRLAFA